MSTLHTFNTDVPTADGNMDCYVATADQSAAKPAVILYMDAPGIRSELERFANRIAEAGYVCLLPDLYYRSGHVRFDLSKGKDEFKRMFAAVDGLTVEMILRDTEGMLHWLSESALATDSTGVIGYCMSGQFVVAAAGAFPDRILASASQYGTRIVTDAEDSPHLTAHNARAELYLGFASHDPYVEDHVVPTLAETLTAAGVRHTIETHPDTEHGFCFPERPAYVEAAAESVWQTVFDLYARNLH